MDLDPYCPPVAPSTPSEQEANYLRLFAVARYRRNMNISVLTYGASLLSFKLTPSGGVLHTVVAFGAMFVLIAAAAFVMLLGGQLHSWLVGIALGLATLFPCAGMAVPYFLNSQAVDLLKRNGYGSGGMLGLGLDPFRRR